MFLMNHFTLKNVSPSDKLSIYKAMKCRHSFSVLQISGNLFAVYIQNSVDHLTTKCHIEYAFSFHTQKKT